MMLFVIVTTSLRTTNNILSIIISKVSYRNYKRTWQEVSNELLSYLYNTSSDCYNNRT